MLLRRYNNRHNQPKVEEVKVVEPQTEAPKVEEVVEVEKPKKSRK